MTRLPITPADCAPTIITWRECIYYSHRLVNNNTETAWWHKAARANAVCFFQSRISFWRPGQGEATSPRQGQNLFYFGPLVGKFADVFGAKGIIYRSNP